MMHKMEGEGTFTPSVVIAIPLTLFILAALYCLLQYRSSDAKLPREDCRVEETVSLQLEDLVIPLSETLHSNVPVLENASMNLPKMVDLAHLLATSYGDPDMSPYSFGNHIALGSFGNNGLSENSFFGVAVGSERIVIAVDVSESVIRKLRINGIPFESLQQELITCISELNPDHLFSLIQFSRNYECFSNALVPAHSGNREAAIDWVLHSLRHNGRSAADWIRKPKNGIESIVDRVSELGANKLILLTDGSFQRNNPDTGYGEDVPWEDLYAQAAGLNGKLELVVVLILEKNSDLGSLQQWVDLTHGEVRILPPSL
ncbi:MAG: hypothetical protein JW739_06060 [Opitutales bacterium]|nr:hypothetical protein [Opitutales bacterium]